ncbi:M20 family metallopeptidase [Lacrimispora sp.]|uniref:M20 family metallopeptidase n=1 Tax=Lacrimispora sp. TaxID=2719234 RepID=UPI0028A0BBFF|nr:ArgE/DapE family deacylase [Lacrimispora sp.]
MMERLKEVLERNREEYVKYLSELIAIDTQDLGHGIAGGREKEGQEYLIRLLEEMGSDKVERDPMTEETITASIETYGEGNHGHDYKDRYNVYAVFKGQGSKSLMFNGHMDTMPPGDEFLWNVPPHVPAIVDGKLFGLGAADMKGGLMASVMAVKLLKDAGIPLPLHVHICSVCDEEGGGNGSIQAVMRGKRADGVVVCEPTSGELILAHMGFVFMKVRVTGKSNHSGAKWLGVSAIEKAIKIIERLNELEHGWLLGLKHPLLPAPNLNVGTIHGGSAGSTVAGDCEFEMCIHYLPGLMSHEQVVAEVTDEIRRLAESDLWLREHMPEISIYQAGGPFEMEKGPFVDSFERAFEKAEGKPVAIKGSPAGCDSRLWRNIAGCPTIQFGPGNLEQCHSVNEYIQIEEYLKAIHIYAQLILEWGKEDRTDE